MYGIHREISTVSCPSSLLHEKEIGKYATILLSLSKISKILKS